nr:reverse transcriptase domain-containing protein [Tanacetum cinerariifolium]
MLERFTGIAEVTKATSGSEAITKEQCLHKRKSSSDPGYDTVFDSNSEDLSVPYRRPKLMPFTSRITRFRYHRRAKLLANVRVYEGNKDPKDHLSIFSATAEQEEWPMLVWCKMFRQTLSGLARNWFDSLDPKSVDGCKELSNKFLEEFSQQKRYHKHPIEIHGIKRKPNERLQAFMDLFKAESTHIKGVPLVLRISAFIKEGFTPPTKTLKELFAMDNVNFPPPPLIVGTPEKPNMNKFCDYHQDRDIKQSGQNNKGSAKGKEKVISVVRSQGYRKSPYERVEHGTDNAIAFPSVPRYQLMNCPVVIDAMIEGFRVRKIYVDGGSSSKSCMRIALGILITGREVIIEEYGRTGTVIMEFTVVKSPSPYNDLLGRTGMRSLGATRPWSSGKEPIQLDDVEERQQHDKGRKPPKSSGYHEASAISFMGFQSRASKEDDMVIKSQTEQDIIRDVEQTFSTLQKINMKLNPKKCLFEMEEVKFLGYVVTSEDGQRLLKQHFIKMKKLVSELPNLTTRKKGKTLMIYLAAADEAVNAVLFTEGDRRKMSVHYVRRSLQGVKTNYALMEKLTLALVHAARQLRRYFYAHPIKVIIDSPINQVLRNSEAS